MTADDFRRIVLALDGTAEGAHMGHPDFRVNGRIFASLKADELCGVVKLTPEEQEEFLRLQPKTFEPAAGAWGRQGWTMVRLGVARESAVRGAIALAWEAAAARPPRRPARRTSVKRSTKHR
jgi:YjbR